MAGCSCLETEAKLNCASRLPEEWEARIRALQHVLLAVEDRTGDGRRAIEPASGGVSE